MRGTTIILGLLPILVCGINIPTQISDNILNKYDPKLIKPTNLFVNKLPGCQINIRALQERHPLFRNPLTKQILLPNWGTSTITVPKGTDIELDCPGAAHVNIGDIVTGEIAIATCQSGEVFTVGSSTVEISTAVCTRRIASIAKYTGRKCWGTGREIEVGFEFTDGNIIHEYYSCFDDVNRNVLYTLFNLTKQIGEQQTGGTRPTWAEGNFYNLPIRLNNLYPNAQHRITINRQVGLPDDDTTFVKPTGNYYVARGHLIARSDYIYYAQQDATFHYINSLPQWQTFNALNWFFFERNVRQYASSNHLDLLVMTGGYGVSTLPHAETGKDVKLHFYNDENGIVAIPIPELFWKVVYSPETEAGVAILGINNPYQMDVERSVICNDIADELTWLTFDRTRIEAGYIYACTVDDLRRAIPQIPHYNIRRILN